MSLFHTYDIDDGLNISYIRNISKGEIDVTAEAKKEKILASIATRGWISADIYFNEASELRASGLIKMGERFSVGGNRKSVWVAA